MEGKSESGLVEIEPAVFPFKSAVAGKVAVVAVAVIGVSAGKAANSKYGIV